MTMTGKFFLITCILISTLCFVKISLAVEKDEDRSLVKRYGVEGFPTILLVDSNGDKIKTYNGPRTSQGLLDFCHENN